MAWGLVDLGFDFAAWFRLQWLSACKGGCSKDEEQVKDKAIQGPK